MEEGSSHGQQGAPQIYPASPRSASASPPGHLDVDAEHAHSAQAHEERTLGPEAARWAQSLLEVARFELARADDKANTLFRFYGVVAALSIGLLAGRGWTPTDLGAVSQTLFWLGCLALLTSGYYLGVTLYPRDIRETPAQRLLYFGHVIAYQSVDDLATALRNVEEDTDHRLVEQLLGISRLVHKKYALTRRALMALGVGVLACIVAVLSDALVTTL